ncbi:MAG: 4-(cytidine 5'-diphospho)-2-C-methyl-D-erythritol kinase [Clostridia bacterium]|nr:4-(cytidine 5'-diphospho)-2-C-methyl-D-erythritol kinase [Clostridia bacterium]
MAVKMKAYAKINLFLDILGKLENGYHSLFMVMQSIDLCDYVEVEKAPSGIDVTVSDRQIPRDGKNTAYKAAKIFFEDTGIKGGAAIGIEKHIPVEAGLAGGSADAAAVLCALNELYDAGLSQPELCRMGLKVGSDVPFCVVGGTCLAQNTGGILSPLVELKNCCVVLAKPDRGVSTKWAYEQADSMYLYHPDRIRILDFCEKGDIDGICKYAGNVFEQIVEVPERVEIKRIMREHGSKLCQMSGSGPTVFGIFEDEKKAREAAVAIEKICGEVYVTGLKQKGTEKA